MGQFLQFLEWEILDVLVNCHLAVQTNVFNDDHDPTKVIPAIPQVVGNNPSY